ncbi:hypothetical protein SB6413_00915 [Klebsiella pasteurii]|uniref:DUF551 domain-containing protein n=1 Tax=Klebsiella pasteurii TaxID=2587529 RepID=UPI001168DCA5|nr:DUF551 domain-containing protein [Klebsiella pasteurii]VUS98043.1 hypothetical protein SB6413_00915 [Klebsiella pasteurii]
MKDHEIRELVNQLRDVAIKYHGSGQLREQIARTVRAAMLQAYPVCTCPSGDGSLRWPCQVHPGNSPVIPGAEQRIADAVELLKKAAPAMLADNSGPDGPLAGRMKSPVIPDGLIAAVNRLLDSDGSRGCYSAIRCYDARAEVERLLAAAPKPQNSPQNIPEIIPGWIPVSERMPEGSEEVLCAKEFDGPGGWRRKVGYLLAGKWTVYGASWTPTHWMPLPDGPQEVKGE